MSASHQGPRLAVVTSGQPGSHAARVALDVLVVEDNLVNQKVVVALLTKWGHRSVVACDGARGLEELAQHDFDLVLMDIQMPVMDGIQATLAIRTRERQTGGHIPIIAITAHARAQDQIRSLEAGMDRYLTKPVDSALLRQAIAELLPVRDSRLDVSATTTTLGEVDFGRLVEFVGEDPDRLAEVVQIFLEDSPVTLADAARAIDQANARALEMAAHRLKCSLVTMGAQAASETANALELLGHAGVLDGASHLFERLSREIAATRATLGLWKARRAA